MDALNISNTDKGNIQSLAGVSVSDSVRAPVKQTRSHPLRNSPALVWRRRSRGVRLQWPLQRSARVVDVQSIRCGATFDAFTSSLRLGYII